MRTSEDVEYIDPANGNGTAGWKPTSDNTVIHSGLIEFLYLPEGMRDRTPHIGMDVPMSYEEYLTWITEACSMMRLTMFQKSEFDKAMLQDTGYNNHVRLGENAEFVCYLSSNEPANDLPQAGKDFFAAQGALKETAIISEPRLVDDFYLGLTIPIVERTGVNFLALVPDSNLRDSLLKGVVGVLLQSIGMIVLNSVRFGAEGAAIKGEPGNPWRA